MASTTSEPADLATAVREFQAAQERESHPDSIDGIGDESDEEAGAKLPAKEEPHNKHPLEAGVREGYWPERPARKSLAAGPGFFMDNVTREPKLKYAGGFRQ